MANIQFGTGTAAFIPSSVNAALLANPTPQTPSLLQEMSVDFKAGNKKLYGRGQFAVDVARGQINATGKGKIGSTDPLFLNQLYFGMPSSVGAVRPISNESHPPAASVVVTQGATFVKDQGVTNGTTGIALLRVASAPAAGQYSVVEATGTYSFAAGETEAAVLISYTYADAATGTTITLASQNNGYTPEFELNLFNTYRGKLFALRLFRCKMTDINLATKHDDYWMSDFTYDICANDANNVGCLYADQ